MEIVEELKSKLGLSREKILSSEGQDAAKNMLVILSHIKNTAGFDSRVRVELSQGLLEWQRNASETVRNKSFCKSFEAWIVALQCILIIPDDLPAGLRRVELDCVAQSTTAC